MKLRTGFVSNSSSSSFVIMVEKSLSEKVCASLPQYHRDLIAACVSEVQAFGKTILVCSDMEDMSGNSFSFYDFDHTLDGRYSDSRRPVEGLPEIPKNSYGSTVRASDVLELWASEAKKIDPNNVFENHLG